MSNRKRDTRAKGIYKDKFGWAIRISVKGKPVEFRREKDIYHKDTGVLVRLGESYKERDLPWLREERIRRQADALLKVDVKEAADTLFPADVQRFLSTISSKGHRVNTQGYMKHWETPFASKKRNAITDLDAQTAFAGIQQAHSTKRHIRRALVQFYDALNGKSGYNPGRSLPNPPKDGEPVRDLPWPAIEKLFKALPPSRSKARLMLIAYVGLPQKQIAMLKPSDLRLDRRELVVHPRRKGAGAAGRVVPLSDVAVKALREFARLEAFGTFQNRQLVETFWSGARKAKITLPEDARPYDLRHSFLTEVARAGADIRDIAHLGMHATLEQASRYIKGASSVRATNAIAAVSRFSATKKPGRAPKDSSMHHSKPAQKGRRRTGGQRKT